MESLPEEQFSFTLVGDGNMKEELINFIKNKSNCKYLGFIENPELIEIYKRADVLLQPSLKTASWEELFGMSIIEGMACATIPIATNHSGPMEIINHGHSGYLFSEKEYVINTVRILKQLQNNLQKLARLKENAYNEANKYRPDQIFNKWNEFLKLDL